PPVSPIPSRFCDRPCEFAVDDLLNPFKATTGRELLVHELPRLLKRHDSCAEQAQFLQPLRDGGLADPEVLRGIRLTMGLIKEALECLWVNSYPCHDRLPEARKQNSLKAGVFESCVT